MYLYIVLSCKLYFPQIFFFPDMKSDWWAGQYTQQYYRMQASFSRMYGSS